MTGQTADKLGTGRECYYSPGRQLLAAAYINDGLSNRFATLPYAGC